MQQRLTQLNEYKAERNSLVREVAPRPEDKIELEIGDTKSDEFIPQAKIIRWDNETNFSIRRDNGARSFIERDGKIVAESRDENVVIYELEPDEQNEDGGMEIEIELPSQPTTNVFEFTLQTKGLNFFYQPALTALEIKQGSSQPENVVGSYAVYHATKRDNRVGGKHYKTGKAFHIYRPKAIDADGVEVWCELNIDEQAGVLTVTVPQQWLDRASYPVRVDPTFGYTSAGGTALTSFNNRLLGGSFDLSENGDISKLTAYTINSSPTKKMVGGIYNSADSKLGNTQEINAPANTAWRDLAFPSAVPLTTGTYSLVVASAGGTVHTLRGDSGSQTYVANFSLTYSSTLPSTTSFSTGSFDTSIYATYTATASAPTVTTQAVSSIDETTATGNGNVTDDGGATITERGVCWATTTNPTTASSKATSAGTTGAFTASITGLTASTLYYVRAYAINSEGTSYGDNVTFTTDAAAPTSPLSLKQGGVFGVVTTKVKVGGTFQDVTPQIKVGGVFQ